MCQLTSWQVEQIKSGAELIWRMPSSADSDVMFELKHELARQLVVVDRQQQRITRITDAIREQLHDREIVRTDRNLWEHEHVMWRAEHERLDAQRAHMVKAIAKINAKFPDKKGPRLQRNWFGMLTTAYRYCKTCPHGSCSPP